MVFLRYGAGRGGNFRVFSTVLYREQNKDSVQEASIPRLLCYCVSTTSRWHIVSVCCRTTIAVTWYSTSIVPFLIPVWKKHSDLPAGRRNVNSLSRFDPKQLTELNNQPNINARSHRAPLLRRSSIPTENVRQRAIWVQPSSRPTSASQLCAVLIGWKVARDGGTVAQSQEEEYQ